MIKSFGASLSSSIDAVSMTSDDSGGGVIEGDSEIAGLVEVLA